MIGAENNVFNNLQLYQLVLTSLTGESIDLSNKFMKIDLYEDLFSYYHNGLLFIADTDDMIKNLPIIGGEKLSLLWSDSLSNSALSAEMIVDSVLPQIEKSNELNKNHVFILKLVSEEFFNQERIRISRSYNDVDGSRETLPSIIEEALSLSVKSFLPVRTSPEFTSLTPKFVSNNWNVIELLDFLTSQTEDALFYHGFDNYFFNSLSYLLTQPTTETFQMLANLENKTNFNTVLNHFFDRVFDVNQIYKRGGFGKTTYDVDLTKYSYKKNEKTLHEVYDEFPKLGNNYVFDRRLSSNKSVIDVNYNNTNAALKRNIIMQSLSNHNLICQMNGYTKRHVGQLINFNLPSTDRELINNNFQGTWLITQIHHIILNNYQYKQNIRLWKNAFFNNTKVGA